MYFLDVGLIFQAGGQTEGWPLSLCSMTLLTKDGLRGMESRQERDLFLCVLIGVLIRCASTHANRPVLRNRDLSLRVGELKGLLRVL